MIWNAGSGASSSSESDVGCLQSGVCAKQKNVSSRDSYIAKESLELLVACLQLRSPLLGQLCVLCVYLLHIQWSGDWGQNDTTELI